MKIKQWFCEHVWDKMLEEFLYSERIRSVKIHLLLATGQQETYVEEEYHYVIHYSCIKCDKIKIEEEVRIRRE